MQFLWSAFLGGLFFGLFFPTLFFWINRQLTGTDQPRRAFASTATLVWLYLILLGLVMGVVRAGMGYVFDSALDRSSFSYGIGATLGSFISMMVFVRRWLPTK